MHLGSFLRFTPLCLWAFGERVFLHFPFFSSILLEPKPIETLYIEFSAQDPNLDRFTQWPHGIHCNYGGGEMHRCCCICAWAHEPFRCDSQSLCPSPCVLCLSLREASKLLSMCQLDPKTATKAVGRRYVPTVCQASNATKKKDHHQNLSLVFFVYAQFIDCFANVQHYTWTPSVDEP